MHAPQPPFVLGESVDKPAVVGARWWNEALKRESGTQSRRALLLMGGLIAAGVGLPFACEAIDERNSTKTANRSSLEMQETYGWNFGAPEQMLTFEGQTAETFTWVSAFSLPQDLAPSVPALVPYAVPTLFQSCLARPKLGLPEDTSVFHQVIEELRGFDTSELDASVARGEELASLIVSAPKRIALVVDLAGPSSVAFAAGARHNFTPVFCFDNWPHPRGVVPAHKTLAAAMVHQSDFVAAAQNRPATAPAMFVLDRARLTPYTDATSQFDNRYLARLPPAATLKSLGYQGVLYVGPATATAQELDDLNDLFLDYASHGVVVRVLGADALNPHGPRYRYGLTEDATASFWTDYAFDAAPPPPTMTAGIDPRAKEYVPKKRQTAFSGRTVHTLPDNFAVVPVVLTATGILLGAQLNRNGSWNRTSGGYGGG